MVVFRLTRRKYASGLSGAGAAKSDNRWNSRGTEIIYTAQNRALALAEIAVHLPLSLLPPDYVMLEIDIPEELEVSELSKSELHDDWSHFPYSRQTQEVGDRFIMEQEYPVLRVPSAVVMNEFNFLINPHHPDFKKIEIICMYDFLIDTRLLVK